jgi:hypothetical protein
MTSDQAVGLFAESAADAGVATLALETRFVAAFAFGTGQKSSILSFETLSGKLGRRADSRFRR